MGRTNFYSIAYGLTGGKSGTGDGLRRARPFAPARREQRNQKQDAGSIPAREHGRVLQQDQFQNALVQFFRPGFAQGPPVSVQNHTQVAGTGRFQA